MEMVFLLKVVDIMTQIFNSDVAIMIVGYRRDKKSNSTIHTEGLNFVR